MSRYSSAAHDLSPLFEERRDNTVRLEAPPRAGTTQGRAAGGPGKRVVELPQQGKQKSPAGIFCAEGPRCSALG